MLSIKSRGPGRMSRFGILIMVMLSMWVLLGISSFFMPFLHRGSERAAIEISSVMWLVIFSCMTTFIKRDGYSGWGMVYYGRVPHFNSGIGGVLKCLFYLVAFSLLVGSMGAGIFTVPTVFFAKSISSSDFQVTNISYFRGSITHKYLIDVVGNKFSGQFLSNDNEPALSDVRIKDNNLLHGIDCLHINYRYWYFGAVVESLQNCAVKNDLPTH